MAISIDTKSDIALRVKATFRCKIFYYKAS